MGFPTWISTPSGDSFPGATLVDDNLFKRHLNIRIIISQTPGVLDCFCELFHVVPCFCSARRESSVLFLLEDRLRALPSFRRLAFEEIHTAGHWGRKLSGGGSSAEITMPWQITYCNSYKLHQALGRLKAVHHYKWWIMMMLMLLLHVVARMHHDEPCFLLRLFC